MTTIKTQDLTGAALAAAKGFYKGAVGGFFRQLKQHREQMARIDRDIEGWRELSRKLSDHKE